MGEAKRRREQEGPLLSDEQLRQRFEALTDSSNANPNTEHVLAMAIKLSHVGEVAKALGGSPALLSKLLKELEAVPTGTVDGVWWEMWPSGRQSVNALTAIHQYRDALDLVYERAMARGYGMKLLAFPDDGWSVKLKEVTAQNAEALNRISDALAETPDIRRQRPRPDMTVLYIPRVVGPAAREAVDIKLLRLFDQMASTKELMLNHGGTVRFGFEGYDDEKREAWEFEAVRQSLHTLNTHAPWWPWLVGEEQFVVWLGALAAEGLTSVNAEGMVGFKVSQASLMQLTQSFIQECVQALLAVGIDPESKPVADFLERHFRNFGETARIVNERATAHSSQAE